MRVLAKDFHPMRGHVDANVVVEFANGAVLSVQPAGVGWALYNAFGDRVSEPTNDAYVLTSQIMGLDADPMTPFHNPDLGAERGSKPT